MDEKLIKTDVDRYPVVFFRDNPEFAFTWFVADSAGMLWVAPSWVKSDQKHTVLFYTIPDINGAIGAAVQSKDAHRVASLYRLVKYLDQDNAPFFPLR